MVISTKMLAYYGYINNEERLFLDEIYECNPLLFDYVCKRTLKAPQDSIRPGAKLSKSIFVLNENLFGLNSN